MYFANWFFRGDFMRPDRAMRLLTDLCAVEELCPDVWNTYEPINRPFYLHEPNDIIDAMISAKVPTKRTLVFLVRKQKPRWFGSLDLLRGPVQWRLPHNEITIEAKAAWKAGDTCLVQYVSGVINSGITDYARVDDKTNCDPNRLNEFHRSYTAAELAELFANRKITARFGPYGCPEDIYWFNVFGKVYVDLIGRKRLMSAGWEHVEELGDCLACYATKEIASKHLRERKDAIGKQLEEFIFTPHCRREDKRIPKFDFSEQEEALERAIHQKSAN